jgi:molybdenum cofactor biosynthesis enzyme MoaA
MGACNKLRLLVTDACQLDCYYCHQEARRDEDAGFQLGYEGFCAVLDAGRFLDFGNVRVSGGEPLLRFDLTLALLKAALEKGYSDVGLTTNGVLLSHHWPRLGDWVVNGGIRVGVTLNAVDSETYQSITRRSPRMLQKTLSGIRLLADLPQAKVISVVSRRNLAGIAEVLHTSAELGLLHKLVDVIDPLPREYISITDIERMLVRLGYRRTRECGDYQFFENQRSHRVQVPHRVYYPRCLACSLYPCREGDLAIRIYPDGMVRACFGSPPMYIARPDVQAIASVLTRAKEWSASGLEEYQDQATVECYPV